MFFRLFIFTVPKKCMSHIVGYLVQLRLPPPLGRWAIKAFVKKYNIRLDEAEHPLDYYKSIGDLFIRKLKKDLRPIEASVIHPADSDITQGGVITDGHLIQCKGKKYSLEQFLGLSNDDNLSNDDKTRNYEGGFYCTYYLCPTDYHRVHCPVEGMIRQATHIPGALWPVNVWSVNNIENLFAINERVITYVETSLGVVAVVMVGATNVGKMTMSYDPQLVTNRVGQSQQVSHKKYGQKITISAGDELGIFHMGSSVVVLYPPAYKELLDEKDFLFRGNVLMGQGIQSLSESMF